MTRKTWYLCRRASTKSLPSGTVFSFFPVEERPGLFIIHIIGKNAEKLFQNESGGHRFQRIPPTERRGRMQTSTITVAVLPEPQAVDVPIREDDLEWTACRGSGSGGQKRNKTANAVQLRHRPSGLLIRVETERSLTQNKATALASLRAKLWDAKRTALVNARAADRKAQVGCGARGDKIRTIRTQDDLVTDHQTGRTWSWKKYLRGDWD